MNWINSVSSTSLTKSLDGLWEKQRAVNDNIANYETPGYKKKYVSFEEELKNILDSRSNGTRTQTIDRVKDLNIYTGVVEEQNMRNDNNNVDIEKENVELARVQLQYSLATRQLSDHYARLRQAISGAAR